MAMKRVRIERKTRRSLDDRHPLFSLDPRDQDVVRAKLLTRPGTPSSR